MSLCRKCHTDNPDDSRTCGNCGEALPGDRGGTQFANREQVNTKAYLQASNPAERFRLRFGSPEEVRGRLAAMEANRETWSLEEEAREMNAEFPGHQLAELARNKASVLKKRLAVSVQALERGLEAGDAGAIAKLGELARQWPHERGLAERHDEISAAAEAAVLTEAELERLAEASNLNSFQQSLAALRQSFPRRPSLAMFDAKMQRMESAYAKSVAGARSGIENRDLDAAKAGLAPLAKFGRDDSALRSEVEALLQERNHIRESLPRLQAERRYGECLRAVRRLKALDREGAPAIENWALAASRRRTWRITVTVTAALAGLAAFGWWYQAHVESTRRREMHRELTARYEERLKEGDFGAANALLADIRLHALPQDGLDADIARLEQARHRELVRKFADGLAAFDSQAAEEALAGIRMNALPGDGLAAEIAQFEQAAVRMAKQREFLLKYQGHINANARSDTGTDAADARPAQARRYNTVAVLLTASREILQVPGDAPTIATAMAMAQAGDLIWVGPGVYRETIQFKSGVRLVGESAEKSVIELSEAKNAAIIANGSNDASITNITVRGKAKSNDGEDSQAGMRLVDAQIDVTFCIIQNIGGYGIFATGTKCALKVFDNRIEGCSEAGIAFFQGAGGMAERNEVVGNGKGILVSGQRTRPFLRQNTCKNNKGAGIQFNSGSGGVAERNECAGNGNGIVGHGKGTAPVLTQNVCSNNKSTGIQFGDGAGGTAEGNNCAGNDDGIWVFGQGTAPVLKRNVCRNNRDAGIRFGSGAGGAAEDNVCASNKAYGIDVEDHGTKPTLQNNKFANNVAGSMRVAGGAASIGQGATPGRL